VDVATVYQKLLPPAATTASRLARLTNADLSCSGFILLLGVNKLHPQLAHHNIFFSSDYRGEFEDIFRRGVPPEEPTIYVAITSKADPAHAPAESENWFVLVNSPSVGSNFDWQAQVERYRDRVLDQLANFGLDLRQHIQVERRLTPIDLERLTGARHGALYGSSSNSPLAAFRRPHNRAGNWQGLYFVGGATHPGGGVPMVMLSGRVVANMILYNRKIS
jgi:phytoene desaturase